jgi:ankyrin repeat protein
VFSIFNKNALAAKSISEHLLKFGADPNFKNKEKWSPLHLAVKKG